LEIGSLQAASNLPPNSVWVDMTAFDISTNTTNTTKATDPPIPSAVQQQQYVLLDKEANIASNEINSSDPLLRTSAVVPYGAQNNMKRDMGVFHSMSEILKLAGYFSLWYILTIVYNVTNKRALIMLPALPTTLAATQMFLGMLLFLPIWAIKPPQIDSRQFLAYWKIGLCHGLGSLFTIYSLNAGSVSFTHVVKAAEPLFAAGLSAVVMKQTFSTSVYLSLLPIIIGIAMASITELNFSWYSLITAMLSNLCYQSRIVLAKGEMRDTSKATKDLKSDVTSAESDAPGSTEQSLSPSNLFRIVTVFGCAILVPIAIFLEGEAIWNTMTYIQNNDIALDTLLVNVIVSGISYYAYNDVAFWILGESQCLMMSLWCMYCVCMCVCVCVSVVCGVCSRTASV
jgi:solute carrier family 35 protein E1